MRNWTLSACLVAASCALPLMAANGSCGPGVPQASISIVSSSDGSSTHAAPAARRSPKATQTAVARRPTARDDGTTTGGTMPRWLKLILLLAGLLTLSSFLIEPVAILARRRRQDARTAHAAARAVGARAGSRIIRADHDRLIVTYSAHHDTVYLLTPPGENPWSVLRAARVVVPERTYVELADHLGVPSVWPYE